MPVQESTWITIVLPMYKPGHEWERQFLTNVKELNDFVSPYTSINYIVVHDGPAPPEMRKSFEKISGTFPFIQFSHYAQNQGKGYALRHGVSLSRTPFTLTMDFDFPYQKEGIKEMIAHLQEDHDIIVGKRSVDYFHQIPLKRKVISKLFSWLAGAFLDIPLKDTQSGIKGFNIRGRQTFLETTINRFLVDTEFVLRASKKKQKIKTINITPKPGLLFTNFGFRVIKTETGNFLKLLRIKYFSLQDPGNIIPALVKRQGVATK